MRTIFAFMLGLAAVSVVAVSAAEAQTQPKPFAWERKTNRLLRPDPIDWLGRAHRVLNREIRKLNLPKNRIFGSGAQPIVVAPSSDAARHAWLDSNRDGFISRGEYLAGRSRPVRAGAIVRNRHLSRQARLRSRFRAADLDRDGKLSLKELDGIRNRRF